MSCLVGQMFQETCKHLQPVSKDLSHKEAELIFEDVLNISRSTLYTSFNTNISQAQYELIKNIIKRRLSGKPLAHVLGSIYFHSKSFFISKEALIPRPDTEILIEEVLKNETSKTCRFIDIGTGSGNIAESLCYNQPQWKAIAIDISGPSLQLAKKNCSERINLLCCDKLSAINKQATFDFIVTNPPYISKMEMINLEASVIDYEPSIALYGGEDGLDFYRYLAIQGKVFLRKAGWIYCEIGLLQGETCTAIFNNAGWKNISISHDLASRPRIIKAQMI